MVSFQKLAFGLLALFTLTSCGGNSGSVVKESSIIQNREAPIPSQCYTKTEGIVM